MAQYRLNAYDADVWISEFKGLSPAADEMNSDLRYAAEAVNMETKDGALMPAPPLIKYAWKDATHNGVFGADQGTMHDEKFVSKKYLLDPTSFNQYDRQEFEQFNTASAGECKHGESLHPVYFDQIYPRTGRLYRSGANQEYVGSGFAMNEFYVACLNCHVYISSLGQWFQISYMDDNELTGEFHTDEWSIVSCTDVLPSTTDENAEVTVQCVFMSNTVDGMFRIRLDNKTCEKVSTPVNFSWIEYYAERLWGCSKDDKSDSIFYSAPYAPSDWEPNTDIPEDGAGEIALPNFDGDDFHGTKVMGDYLYAFKRNAIYRLTGTDPSTFSFQKQFGIGTKFMRSICVYQEKMYMVTQDGLAVYDGNVVVPILREYTDPFWKEVFKANMRDTNADLDYRTAGICANIIDGKYCVAYRRKLTVDDEDMTNNEMLVYDLTEGTVFTYQNILIDDFAKGSRLMLTHGMVKNQGDTDYSVQLIPRMIWMDSSWDLGKTNGLATKWVSPWVDFGYKTIKKGGFDLYFLPEVKDTAVTLKISVQTEKKTKTKNYIVNPLTADEIAAGKKHKQKKLHFGGAGRRFRIMIETEAGNTAPWRITGGLHMIAETDSD